MSMEHTHSMGVGMGANMSLGNMGPLPTPCAIAVRFSIRNAGGGSTASGHTHNSKLTNLAAGVPTPIPGVNNNTTASGSNAGTSSSQALAQYLNASVAAAGGRLEKFFNELVENIYPLTSEACNAAAVSMMKPLDSFSMGAHGHQHHGPGQHGRSDSLTLTASLALANRAAKAQGSDVKAPEPVYNNECFLLVFLLCQYMRYREVAVKSKLFTMLIRCYER